MPRVTICLPTYNGAAWLPKTISCILAQTFLDFKLLIVDNGSTDGTGAVAQSFADARVQYSRHETNLGMTANWNRALALGLKESCDYIGVFHQDDYYAPRLLEREAAFLDANPKTGLVYPAFYYYNEAENRYSLRRPYHRDCSLTAVDALRDVCFERKYAVGTPAVIARKDAFLKAGAFDESFKICPDLDLWWRIAEHFDLGYVCEPLHVHTVHPAQISSSPLAVENAVTQGEIKRALDLAVQRISRRDPTFDAGRYSRGVAHFCAIQALIAAKDALLSGQLDAARRMCRGAVKLRGSLDIRLIASMLIAAAHTPGRIVCLAAVKWLRRLRAAKQAPTPALQP